MNSELLQDLKEIWANAEKLKKMPHFNFNEANTKEVIIKKVLEFLGWRIESGEMSMEFPVSTEKGTISIDYALILNGEPKVIVECKSLSKKLGDAESMQVMKYAFYSNIRWSILTNGKEWIVSNSEYKEEFFRFDLSKPSENISNIKLLSKESLEDGALINNFEDSYTAQVIARFLKENKGKLTREIHNEDKKLNMETINRIWNYIKIENPDINKEEGDKTKKPKQTGFPIEIYADYKGTRYDAKLLEDGKVIYNGKEYPSPSGASAPVVAPSSSRNGWTFWKLKENDKLIKTIQSKIISEVPKVLFMKKLNQNQREMIEKLKTLASSIGPDVGCREVQHYMGLGYTPKNYKDKLNIASFNHRKKGLKVDIRIPYEKLQNKNALLYSPENPAGFAWWNGEITIARIYTIEDLENILPALKEAYELLKSRYE